MHLMNCNRLQFMDELSAPIHHANDCAHFVNIAMNTVMCTLCDFLSGKVRFMHTSTVIVLDHILAPKIPTRTPRVHLVFKTS